MNTREAFLAEILATPDDDAPRMVYADWLEDNGDPQRADFVRTAHAKGLTERSVVWRHVLKNALPPIVTIMAIQFGYLLGGAVITESIFGWPGLGRLMLDAIRAREYLIIQDTMLIFIVTFILINVSAAVIWEPMASSWMVLSMLSRS